tara:strand:+ start:226 stop:870 length:645 start_codon:yes stop_codon:yes gene_type:complete
MTSEIRHSILENSLKLAGFAVIAALLLGTVYTVSEDRIIEQRIKAERLALNAILPPSRHDNDLINDTFMLDLEGNEFRRIDLLGLRENSRAYIARQNSRVSALIFPLIARDGYNGDINLLLAVNTDGTVDGVRVTAHRETPGLGDKIDLRLSDWILAFNGRSLTNPNPEGWTVVKNKGDFDQFTGATITPRAVTIAIANGLEFFQANKALLLSL